MQSPGFHPKYKGETFQYLPAMPGGSQVQGWPGLYGKTLLQTDKWATNVTDMLDFKDLIQKRSQSVYVWINPFLRLFRNPK